MELASLRLGKLEEEQVSEGEMGVLLWPFDASPVC